MDSRNLGLGLEGAGPESLQIVSVNVTSAFSEAVITSNALGMLYKQGYHLEEVDELA